MNKFPQSPFISENQKHHPRGLLPKLNNRNSEMADTTSQRPNLLQSAPDLGPVVRDRRKSQSLRIDDAAALLGVSVDLMSRLENGQGSVRLDKAVAVLDGLGLTLMVLPKQHPWACETAATSVLKLTDDKRTEHC